MALTAVSTVSQTVNTNSPVVYNTSENSNPCVISYSNGSSTITLKRAGKYLIGFTGTATTVATAGGTVTMHLYANGTEVNGFEASQSATADTVIMNLSQTPFMIRVNPNCCAITDNVPVSITIQNDGTPATFTNANITVTKLS
jgi:hypothetical protein